MQLAKIKEDVQQFANVISDTLDVDVLIVDYNLKLIANTFRYFDKYAFIGKYSAIGSVINTGEKVVCEEKMQLDVCLNCNDFEDCEMTGMIGVPIFYDGVVIGAISLIIPKHRTETIFGNSQNHILFLEHMCGLITSKVLNYYNYLELKLLNSEREALVDNVDVAIISTNNLGCITYYNSLFEQFFNVKEDCVGSELLDIILNEEFQDFIVNPRDFSDYKMQLKIKNKSFYGLVTCKQILITNREDGMLFLFKPFSYIRNQMNALYKNCSCTFENNNNGSFHSKTVSESKKLAVTNQPILIKYNKGAIDETLAECIHCFSNKSDYTMINIDCNKLYEDIYQKKIFGKMGQLSLAEGTTIFFKDVEKIPIFLQDKLTKILKNCNMLSAENSGIFKNSRLIFSTQCNLKELCEKGVFLESLYYRIYNNMLEIKPISNDPTQLKKFIQYTIDYYKICYNKKDLIFSQEILNEFLKYKWSGNHIEIKKVIERLVNSFDGTIKHSDLSIIDQFASINTPTIEQNEKQMIVSLLKSNHTKEEIAKSLGIGRATLYRKIKKYNL